MYIRVICLHYNDLFLQNFEFAMFFKPNVFMFCMALPHPIIAALLFYMLCLINISWRGFYLRGYGTLVGINADKNTL